MALSCQGEFVLYREGESVNKLEEGPQTERNQ